MPPVVIGAVVVGFGTSAPELVVSTIATARGEIDIAVGNIVGSNAANLTLILGVAALICTITVDSKVLRREAPLATAAVVAYGLAVQGGLDRWEGALLLVGMVVVLVLLFRNEQPGSDSELLAEVDDYRDDARKSSTTRLGVMTFIGLVGVIAGAQLAVIGATDIADELDIGKGFIGVTLVAIGTSLPELLTSIAAARKGEDELIVGNLLGSNLFNSLAVGGVSTLVGPGVVTDDKVGGRGVVIMIIVMVVTWLFMSTGRKITRNEAIALLIGYIVAVPLLA